MLLYVMLGSFTCSVRPWLWVPKQTPRWLTGGRLRLGDVGPLPVRSVENRMRQRLHRRWTLSSTGIQSRSVTGIGATRPSLIRVFLGCSALLLGMRKKGASGAGCIVKIPRIGLGRGRRVARLAVRSGRRGRRARAGVRTAGLAPGRLVMVLCACLQRWWLVRLRCGGESLTLRLGGSGWWPCKRSRGGARAVGGAVRGPAGGRILVRSLWPSVLRVVHPGTADKVPARRGWLHGVHAR